MKQVRVIYKQSLADLSVQIYGSIAEIFALAVANNVSVTASIPPNTLLNVPTTNITEPTIQDYYNKHKIQPATAPNADDIDLISTNNPCDFCNYFK